MFDSLSNPSLTATSTLSASAQPDKKMWAPAFRRGPGSAACKRAMDVILAGAAVLVLLPALLMIALAVVLESRGPVLFRQRRTGRDGKVFTILKFRSMTVTEDGDKIAHASKNDKRVTRVGAFIRATSLDELPQLLNVVMGDMSLVGPRPHALAHDNHYGALLPRYADRFAVRPGLTGLAQILGLRGEIHQLSCMARRVDADVEYAAGWTFRDDLLIIWRTVPMILKRVNAY
jgi:putative colanic acid biosynthesis UDP-glucose lipid carrier transferase